MQSFSYYYKGVCGQFLSSIAILLKDSNTKILKRLMMRNKVDKFWIHSYSLLENELQMKPEAYFDKIYELISYELEDTIEPEELVYLNEQRKRYPAIEDLRKIMTEIDHEMSST